MRQARSAALVADLHAYIEAQRSKLSPGHDLARAMNYMLKRWKSFTRFLDDGRVCMSNNAAERGLRGIAAHSGDLERSVRSIMNTESGDHERVLAAA